jgi:hypothetical protein
MARITKTRKPQALPETLLESLMLDHLRTLAVQNYSVHTVRNRQVHIARLERAGRDYAARLGAVSAALVPLPQKERRAVELPFAALLPGPVARLVPMDDAAESHPA